MKRRLCLLLCAALALCVSAAACAEDFDFSGLSLDQLYGVREALNERISALEQAADPKIYDSGTYLVGQSLPAGDYVLTENDNAVFASVAIREGVTEDSGLIAHHLINRQAIVRLKQGTWVTLTEAKACALNQTLMDESGAYGEGGYLAGATVPAGGYVVRIQDKAPLSSYSVYDAVLGAGEALIKFEVIHEATPIELNEGEYIELSGCTLEPEASVNGGN